MTKNRTESFTSENQIRYKVIWMLIFATGAYIIIFTGLSVHRFSLLGDYYDLSLFEQSFWSVVNKGELLVNSQEGPTFGRHTHFTRHFSPLILVVAPFYAAWQDPQMLLFAKTFFLAVAVFPIYGLAYTRLQSHRLALLTGIIFLLYPPLHGLNMWGFHENEFAVFPLAFMLLSYEKKQWKWFWFSVFLALCAKETVSLTLASFGLYLLLFKPEKGIAATLIVIAIFWFFSVDKVVIPFFQGYPLFKSENLYLSRYSQYSRYSPEIFGNSYTQLIINIFTKPLDLAMYALGSIQKQMYLFKLFFPLAFLPLLAAPSSFIIFAPALAMNLLTWYHGQTVLLSQYNADLIPFFFYALCIGICNLDALVSKFFIFKFKADIDTSALTKRIKFAALSVVLSCCVISNITFEIFPFALGRHNQFAAISKSSEVKKAAFEIIKMIPENATVLSDVSLISHLGSRSWLRVISLEALLAFKWDYIIYDSMFPSHKFSGISFKDFNDIITQENYQIVAQKESIILLKK